MQPILSLRGVSKHFKLYAKPGDVLRESLLPSATPRHVKQIVLSDIDLDVYSGEVLGIVGRNGSGKSTLLRIAAGTLTPDSGSVKLTGSVAPISNIGAGLDPESTGLENIRFLAQISMDDEVLEDNIEAICEFADLGKYLHQPVKTYSTGMRARLGFALAIHTDADVLLLDEVLAVGDIYFKRKCFDRINKHLDAGKTAFIVSHDPQTVIQFCSRAILIDGGNILCDGSPKATLNEFDKLVFNDKPMHDTVKKGPPADAIVPVTSHAKPVNESVASFAGLDITDTQENTVIALEQGREYTLNFRIVHHSGCSNLSIGAQLRTPSGQLISGANLLDYQGHTIKSVLPGTTIDASWSFKCELVEGSYFVRVFVTSDDESKTALADDLLAFRVKPTHRKNGGIVNLHQQIDYTIQPPESREN